MIRASAAGVAGSAVFLAVDVSWLALARPSGAELLMVWFAGLAVAGAFLPGLANQVTISRAHLAAPALVYSVEPSKLLHLSVAVAAAGLSDVLDGAVARRLERPSRLGGGLDPVVDGLFFGCVAVGLVLGGAYPAWLAAVVVARYALPAAAGALLLLAGKRPELRHTPLGQASTTTIGLLLGGVALVRGLGWDATPVVAASQVAIPLMALATFANLAWSYRGSLPGR